MQETVILTLYTKSFSRDFELPANIPLSLLYPRLLSVLARVDKSFAGWEDMFLLRAGKAMVFPEASLADYGIYDGELLEVVRKEKQYGF